MTEQEWLTSTDPAAMLKALRKQDDRAGQGHDISDRKLRLWVEACREAVDHPSILTNSPLPLRAALLREIVGNPWRSLDLDRAWCRACGGTDCDHGNSQGECRCERCGSVDWICLRDCFAGGNVQAMAQTIYADRAFADLPILADALEDAGCVEQTILAHLRGPGPHVRGCWVLDLLTGRTQA